MDNDSERVRNTPMSIPSSNSRNQLSNIQGIVKVVDTSPDLKEGNDFTDRSKMLMKTNRSEFTGLREMGGLGKKLQHLS